MLIAKKYFLHNLLIEAFFSKKWRVFILGVSLFCGLEFSRADVDLDGEEEVSQADAGTSAGLDKQDFDHESDAGADEDFTVKGHPKGKEGTARNASDPDAQKRDFDAGNQNVRAQSRIEKAQNKLVTTQNSVRILNAKNTAAEIELRSTTKKLDKVLKQVKAEKAREKLAIQKAKSVTEKIKGAKKRLAQADRSLSEIKQKKSQMASKSKAQKITQLPPYKRGKKSKTSRDIASKELSQN